MKTLNVILCSLLLLMSSCNAQNKQDGTKELSFANSTQKETETLSKPVVRFKVNKQYDTNGNVIRYDSTYSYSYSGTGEMDTEIKKLLGNSNSHFDVPLNFFAMPESAEAPRDSTFAPLFQDSYFQRQMQMHQKWMDEVFRQFHSEQRLPGPDDIIEKKGQKEI
ncbi:hypothetical protein CNR22_17720 [Sphingobacteriaceae bacterium]|nr:hypothetical protein CNR22_17720 [Sphingobacteriaceae bacterium]